MSLLVALQQTSDAALAAALGAFRAGISMGAAVPAIVAMAAQAQEAVDPNKIDRQVAAAYLAAFTRTDQSVGMSRADLAASEIYLKIFSSTPNLNLPGYGFQTAREAQFWRDLFTVAPFLRGRSR